jgi:cob(I)alamin adenosyltransferase
MGNRLSKIYTRTGDNGTTGLGDGSRIEKDSLRMQAVGDVDELNSLIGVLITTLPEEDDIRTLLSRIQHDLFDLGGELATPGYQMIYAERIPELEAILDKYNDAIPPLKNFILPGGSIPAAHCHVARAVARRAERTMVSFNRESPINESARQYINRLSDLLFVLARVLALRNGGQEILWVQANER